MDVVGHICGGVGTVRRYGMGGMPAAKHIRPLTEGTPDFRD